MSPSTNPRVMDIFPWPDGHGFIGAQAWWQHLLTQDDEQKLDFLIGIALLSQEVEVLLLARDKTLLTALQFSETTTAWLQEIIVTSIDELAIAIVHRRNAG